MIVGRPIAKTVFATMALLLAGPSSAQSLDGYNNISVDGDGRSPSAEEVFSSQRQTLQGLSGPGTVSSSGDVAYSMGFELPPALNMPSIGLQYSSNGSHYSTIGRGWQVSAGMTIRRLSSQEMTAYPEVGPDVAASGRPHRVAGGGLNGLLIWNEAGQKWVYVGQETVVPEIDFSDEVWTIRANGLTNKLNPHRSRSPYGVENIADSWHVVRSIDVRGNCIDYQYDTLNEVYLTSVSYGGQVSEIDSSDFLIPPFLFVEFEYGDRVAMTGFPVAGEISSGSLVRSHGGNTDVYNRKLESVTTLSSYLGPLTPGSSYNLIYDYWDGHEQLGKITQSYESAGAAGDGFRTLAEFEYAEILPNGGQTLVEYFQDYDPDSPDFMAGPLASYTDTRHYAGYQYASQAGLPLQLSYREDESSFADYTGDGLPDQWNAMAATWFSSGLDPFFRPFLWDPTLFGDFGGMFDAVDAAGWGWETTEQPIFRIGPPSAPVEWGENGGGGPPFTSRSYSINCGLFQHESIGARVLVDVNGDGFQDIVEGLSPIPDDRNIQGGTTCHTARITSAWENAGLEWRVTYGSELGFTDSVDVAAPAPFPEMAFPTVSRNLNPQVAGFHVPEVAWQRDATVRLMDIDGDGWRDVVIAEGDSSYIGLDEWTDPAPGGTDLFVHYHTGQIDGGWGLRQQLGAPNRSGFPAFADISSGIETLLQELEHRPLDGMSNAQLSKVVPRAVSTTAVRGFRDVNGDGILDYIDASDAVLDTVPGAPWIVWLGTGFQADDSSGLNDRAFSEPMEWAIPSSATDIASPDGYYRSLSQPRPSLSLSYEGRPSQTGCFSAGLAAPTIESFDLDVVLFEWPSLLHYQGVGWVYDAATGQHGSGGDGDTDIDEDTDRSFTHGTDADLPYGDAPFEVEVDYEAAFPDGFSWHYPSISGPPGSVFVPSSNNSPSNTSTVCSYAGRGEPAINLTGLIDVDGDGLLDLVDTQRGLWWRNNGGSFVEQSYFQPFITPSHLDDGLSWSRSELFSVVVANTAAPMTGAPIPTNSVGKTYTRAMVLDIDKDGSLDRVTFPHGTENSAGSLEFGGSPDGVEGTTARAGILTSVTTQPGLRQDFGYQTTARIPPSGTSNTETVAGERRYVSDMSVHSLVVDTVVVEDLASGMMSFTTHDWTDGYCIPGDCRGFAGHDTELSLYDTVLHESGKRQRVAGTTVTTDLDRDWPQQIESETRTSRTQPTLVPDPSDDALIVSQQSYTDVDYRTVYGFDVPRVTKVTTVEGNQDVDEYTRTTSVEYRYDDVGNVQWVKKRLLGAEAGTGVVPEALENGCSTGIVNCSKHVDDRLTIFTWHSSNNGTNVTLRSKRSLHRDSLTSTLAYRTAERVTYGYDGQAAGAPPSDGLLTSTVIKSFSSSANLVWSFTRNDRGAITSTTAPPDAARTHTYELTFGDALRQTVIGPGTWSGGVTSSPEWTTLHDSFGRPVVSTDPNLVEEFTEYDGFGRVVRTERTLPGGYAFTLSSTAYTDSIHGDAYVDTTSYEYASDDGTGGVGRVSRVEMSGAGQAMYSWSLHPDGSGDYLVSESIPDPTGAVTRTRAPLRLSALSHGALLTWPNPSEYDSCRALDVFGRLRATYTGCTADQSTLGGVETTLVHVPGPGTIRAIDPMLDVHQTYSDSNAQVAQVGEGHMSDPLDLASLDLTRTGSYNYDARGRILRFRDGRDNEYRYDLDGAGRLEQVSRKAFDESQAEPWYTYEWLGSEPIRLWEGGDTSGTPDSEWAYDSVGRTIKKWVRQPDGAGVDTYTWSWDNDWYGALAGTTDPWGSVDYFHELGPIGRSPSPTIEERKWSDGVDSTVRRHTYDVHGRDVLTVHPDGSEVHTKIRLDTGVPEYSNVKWSSGEAAIVPLFDQQRGIPSGWSAPGSGAMLDYQFERPGRILGYDFQSGNGLDGRADYQYRTDGLLGQKAFFVNGQARYRTDFDYDPLKRVTEVAFFEGNSGQPEAVETWDYDMLGNIQGHTFVSASSASEVSTWDSNFAFSQPGFREDEDGHQFDKFLWDKQGRLILRDYKKDVSQYWYDGASRLGRVADQDGNESTYGYDAAGEMVFESRNGKKIYHFGSWRYEPSEKTILVKPLPQIAIETVGDYATHRWVFLEPDGHALQTVGGFAGSAQELSFEVLSAYGREFASIGAPLPIDGFHGADEDGIAGVVPFGVRHTLDGVGMWLQPEPLLSLGIHDGNVSMPRNWSGVYAGGAPTVLQDQSGYTPLAIPVVAVGAGALVLAAGGIYFVGQNHEELAAIGSNSVGAWLVGSLGDYTTTLLIPEQLPRTFPGYSPRGEVTTQPSICVASDPSSWTVNTYPIPEFSGGLVLGGGLLATEANESVVVMASSEYPAPLPETQIAHLPGYVKKGIRGQEAHAAIHIAKLAEFLANPTVRPGMEGLPADVIRRQQEVRIKHLTDEIEAAFANIEKLLDGTANPTPPRSGGG